MRKPLASSIALTLGLFVLASATSQAGRPFYGPTGKEVSPVQPPAELPLGSFTVGGAFSESLSAVHTDSMTALWRPGNAVVFYNGRNSYDDNGQYIYSPGLVFRYLVPDHDVIIGFNAYYDFIDSQYDNQFGNVGLGAEVLTKWVDWRFNYYLPTTDDIFMGSSDKRSTSTSVTGPVTVGNVTTTTTTTTTRARHYKTFEADLEGLNTEIGFLIPGLDRYIETRIFAGYYHYNNPFGQDFDGFKARLEAHLLPGVIADVAYWDDKYLNGGHWIAGARVSVPCDVFNIFRGRNPFEGAGEAFRPRQREFRERMSDMVIRSHEVKTVKSGPILTSDKSTSKTTTSTTVTEPPPVQQPPQIPETPPQQPPS
jgi:hypothetical protein